MAHRILNTFKGKGPADLAPGYEYIVELRWKQEDKRNSRHILESLRRALALHHVNVAIDNKSPANNSLVLRMALTSTAPNGKKDTDEAVHRLSLILRTEWRIDDNYNRVAGKLASLKPGKKCLLWVPRDQDFVGKQPFLHIFKIDSAASPVDALAAIDLLKRALISLHKRGAIRRETAPEPSLLIQDPSEGRVKDMVKTAKLCMANEGWIPALKDEMAYTTFVRRVGARRLSATMPVRPGPATPASRPGTGRGKGIAPLDVLYIPGSAANSALSLASSRPTSRMGSIPQAGPSKDPRGRRHSADVSQRSLSLWSGSPGHSRASSGLEDPFSDSRNASIKSLARTSVSQTRSVKSNRSSTGTLGSAAGKATAPKYTY